jgi:4-phosphopantoate--beta-alanine ligase
VHEAVRRAAGPADPGTVPRAAKAAAEGIYTADVVLVPLEDGDRCEALVKMGKKVIVVDLNPLSRSAQTATLTIVDNIVRAVPNMFALAAEMKDTSRAELAEMVEEFSNEKALAAALDEIIDNLQQMK